MTIYLIATKITRTYGHGDFGQDVVVTFVDGYYDKQINPRAYLSREAAERDAKPGQIVVAVEVEL